MSHMELPHVVNTLCYVVRCHHLHRVLYQVGSQINLCRIIHFADLRFFNGYFQVLAPEVSREISPVQYLFVGRGRILVDVKVASEVLLN